MEYRIHKRTGDKISVIGLGTSYIFQTRPKRRRWQPWSAPMKTH